MKLYHWARCSDCREALATLRERGVEFESRDIFARPLDRDELLDLARRAGGIREIFAFRSPSFRRLGADPATLGDARLVELALDEPRLLRRPLAVTGGGRVIVGPRQVAALDG